MGRASARASVLALCVVLCALLPNASAAGAGAGAAHRTAIVIIAGGLEPEPIDRTGTGLMASLGSFALVSLRAAASGDPASYALTAASGVPMTAQGIDLRFGSIGLAYEGETVGSAYARRSGRDLAAEPLSDSAAVAPGWFELVSANASSPYGGHPGLIGESLRLAGLKTAVISAAGVGAATGAAIANVAADAGGSEAGETGVPAAANLAFLLAADAAGIVDRLYTHPELVTEDPEGPGGLRTDARAVAGAVRQALMDPDVGLIVMEFDDVARALDEAESVVSELRRARLEWAYRNLDAVVDAVLESVEAVKPGEVELFVLSLWNRDGYGLLFEGGGAALPGLISSATTRRSGLIALVDVAPTVLQAIGVGPAWSGLGSPAYARASGGGAADDDWAALIGLKRGIVAQDGARLAVLNTFTGSLVVAVALCIAALAHPRRPRSLMKLAVVVLVASCVSPVVLILAPLAGVTGASAILALIFTVSLSVGVFSLWRHSGRPPALTATVEGWATIWAALILFDVLSGGFLARSSVLGHSAIIGARFYGLGNELMGVLLGAGIVSASALWRRAGFVRGRQWGWMLVAGAAALLAVVLGSPSAGSNFGGMVAAAAAAAAALWLGVPRRRVALVAGAVVAVVMAVVIVGMILWVNTRSGSTHIARAVSLARSATGRRELVEIAQRKMAMNIRLMRYTGWTRLLWALIASVLYLVGGGFKLPHEHRLAVLAAITGALAALVANDSGVVACATAAMAPGFLLIAHGLDEAWAGR